MSIPKKISRRAALQVGLGAAAGAAAGGLFAATNDEEACGTPEQTEGPFYPKHDQADKDLDLTMIEGHSTPADGEVIFVAGTVADEDGNPVEGALVDIWQANAHGRYHHEDDPNPAPLDENFQGWGQVRTNEEGRYRFKTIIPGAYPVDEDWWRPPHIHFKVSKRGYRELTTQMYFPDHELNVTDAIFLEVPTDDRAKVIAQFREDDESGIRTGQFDIELCKVPRG